MRAKTSASAAGQPGRAAAGWTDAIAGLFVVLLVCSTFVPFLTAPPVVTLSAAAVFTAAWLMSRAREPGDRLGLVARVTGFCLTGALIAFGQPAMASFQALLHPLAWLKTLRRIQGVMASAAICLAVAAGWILGSPAEAVGAIVSQLSVFVFSVVFGWWITSIADLSEERADLIEQLQATRDEVAGLAAERGAAAERDRIAREVHDTIAQDLAGVVMLIEGARNAPGAKSLAALEHAEAAARRSLDDARALVAGEIDVGAEHRALGDAVREIADRWSRESGIPVGLSVAQVPVSREVQIALVRSLQEALSNARKHARASNVVVSLRREGDEAVLRIDDDGVGLAPGAADSGGFGLSAIQRRAALEGGSAAVRSALSGGTRVEVRVPTREQS